jgi:hypothetical protein
MRLIERLPESGSRGPACEPIGADGALGAVGELLEPPVLPPPDDPPDPEPPGKAVEEPPDDPG